MKTSTIFFHFTLFLLILFSKKTIGQTKVAITIDDVPNTIKYQNDNFKPILLSKLDSLKIPVTIFVTTGLIYKNNNIFKNTELLNNWINRNYINIGYHTYNHSMYSSTGIDSFKLDIEKGEQLLKILAENNNKSVKFFRFPFNDLGKDSNMHVQIVKYLSAMKYRIAPFTIESEDWIFNYIYEYYLNIKDSINAKKVALDYIIKTTEYFDFFDSLSIKQYGRRINQIYLCHDNSINADYLPTLVNELKKKNYSFISLDEAFQDNIYKQEDKYYKHWGISWLYRWMGDQKEIDFYTKQEPLNDTYKLYEQIVKKQKRNKN